MSGRRGNATRTAHLASGREIPADAIAWLDAFARLAERFPRASGLLVTFDGQGNVHAYIDDEEIEELTVSKARTRFSGED